MNRMDPMDEKEPWQSPRGYWVWFIAVGKALADELPEEVHACLPRQYAGEWCRYPTREPAMKAARRAMQIISFARRTP